MNSSHFNDKVALIFGATGGIGSEVSRRLYREGARVVLVAQDREKLQALEKELPGSQTISADIVSSAQVKAAFTFATEKLGAPSMVAHCVGTIPLKAAHQIRDDEWEDAIKINLTSGFFVLREAASLWTREKIPGSLVVCSSAAASVGLANHEVIAAAKAGIEGLVRSSATTYASKGIRINAVAPGLVQTSLSQRIWNSDAALKTSLSAHAIRKIGTPEQIASGICWLLSAEQEWVTGQILSIDGGLSRLKVLGAL